jgi:hypothetical protein
VIERQKSCAAALKLVGGSVIDGGSGGAGSDANAAVRFLVAMRPPSHVDQESTMMPK